MPIQLRIASPCEEPWESMKGDDRVRFCDRCRLNVFNVKSLDEAQLHALFVKSEGQLCGRVYQRRDGTVLTRDCPTGLAKVRRKVLAAAGLIATLLLGIVSIRLREGPGCPTDPEQGWFGRLIGPRVYRAREALRDSPTFGPLIEELSPREATMGRMVRIPALRDPAQP